MRRFIEPERPLIGITTDEENQNLNFAEGSTIPGHLGRCVEAVRRAGAEPLLIPIPEDPESKAAQERIRDLYGVLSGLVLTGGPDINPALYGHEAYETTDDPSLRRDALEWYLCELNDEYKKPTLAICRGMQFLNVFRGGALYQHLPEDLPGGKVIHRSSEAVDIWEHEVKIDPSSLVGKVLGRHVKGDKTTFNSYHHQGLDKNMLGDGLVAVAYTEADGIVEAVQTADPGHFLLAVQQHPESMGEAGDRLFAALAEACRSEALARVA